jgi:HlyD family secretion protein
MKRVVLFATMVLLPALGIALMASSKGHTGAGGSLSAGRAVKTTPLRPAGTIQGLGFVEPVSEVRKLAFKVNGIIARCPGEIGRRYRKGDILIELDSREQRAALEVAEAEWKLAQAQREKTLSGVNPHQIEAASHKVVMLKEQANYWEKEHERAKPLVTRGAVSISEYDKTFTERAQSCAELHQAEADLRYLRHSVRDEDRKVALATVASAKARLGVAKEQFEDTIMRAPFDGTVLELLKREGEGSRLSDPEPVIIFGDMSRLRVRAEVDERFVGALRIGERATIFGKGLRDGQFQGRVVLIKPIMGTKTVFSRSSTERKDLDVVQVIVEMQSDFSVPIGLEVDVKIFHDKN